MSTAATTLKVRARASRRWLAFAALVVVASISLSVAIVALTGGFAASKSTPVRVMPATASPQYIGGHGEQRDAQLPPDYEPQVPGPRP